jgi:hypothetical protein
VATTRSSDVMARPPARTGRRPRAGTLHGRHDPAADHRSLSAEGKWSDTPSPAALPTARPARPQDQPFSPRQRRPAADQPGDASDSAAERPLRPCRRAVARIWPHGGGPGCKLLVFPGG